MPAPAPAPIAAPLAVRSKVLVPQADADDDDATYVVGTPFQSAELKVMLSQALMNR